MIPKDYLSLPDSTNKLTCETGLVWNEKDILDIAISKGSYIYALPETSSPLIIQLYDSSNNLVSTQKLLWDLAILDTDNIRQLLETGQTVVQYAVGHDELIVAQLPDSDNPHGLDPAEYRQLKTFENPVLIKLNMLVEKVSNLQNIIDKKTQWPDGLVPAKKLTKPDAVNLKRQVVKLRHNILDPAIDAAIKAVDVVDTATIYLKLKDMALEEKVPFTGQVLNGNLYYTNSNDKVLKLSQSALRKRLKRRIEVKGAV